MGKLRHREVPQFCQSHSAKKVAEPKFVLRQWDSGPRKEFPVRMDQGHMPGWEGPSVLLCSYTYVNKRQLQHFSPRFRGRASVFCSKG